jgi:hypothetical protein
VLTLAEAGGVHGRLRPPLEENGSTHRLLRVRGRLGTGLVIALCSAGFAACGGGERQDVDEPEGEFPVGIVNAAFPSKQRLAETSDLTLTVANTGDRTIPDLAITIFTESNADADSSQGTSTGDDTATDGTATDGTATEEPHPVAAGSFSVISRQPDLAIPSRPVWILEEGYPKLAGETASAGAEAAQTDTFSFGPLDPNDSREIVWRVTPVQPGTYTVHYRIAAGLQGKAVAITDDGSVPEGQFVVVISDVPPQTRVNDAGKVVPIQKGDIIGQAGTQEQKSELPGGSGGTSTNP